MLENSENYRKCEQCIIRQFNSFKSLTKDELIRIANCKVSKTIKKGEVLFEEGEHIDGVYCIKDGVCKVSKMSNNGKDQIIGLVKKGHLLGERSLINDEVSNLKATAVNGMEVCFIPKEEVIKDLKNNPNFAIDILKTMASSLKRADDLIVNMSQKTVKQRLASTLLYLDTNFKKNKEGAIGIHLSREDIASTIGTATENAIRLLSEFKKKNLIGLKGKQVFIINTHGLQQIAQGF